MAKDIFKRLSAGRPPSVEKAQDRSPAQKLLDWLLRWDKPVVRVRDIRVYGPYALRNQKSVTDSAEVLVKHGWLIPIQTRQYNGHKWRIVRRPIADPSIAAE
jgi:hypothetical protein